MTIEKKLIKYKKILDLKKIGFPRFGWK